MNISRLASKLLDTSNQFEEAAVSTSFVAVSSDAEHMGAVTCPSVAVLSLRVGAVLSEPEFQ